MAVYVFKVYFEEFEEVVRVIHVKSTQTFEDLHTAIQNAIGFDKSQLASFYLSDDQWKKYDEITLMDMSSEDEDERGVAEHKLLMSKTRLGQIINDPHQKFVYIFDFMELWTFHIELTNILMQEDPKLSYPAVVKSIGKAPKQYDNLNKFKHAEDNEFDEIARSLMGDKFDVEHDELDGEESGEEGEDENSGLDEFGGGGEGYDSEERF